MVMAVAAVTAAAFPATFNEHPRIRFSFVYCLPACNKFTRRKNHLRPKILKTLNPRFRLEEIPIPLVRDDPLTDSVPSAPPGVDYALEGMNGGSVVVEGESLQSVEGFQDEVRDEGGFFGEFTVKDVVKFGFWFMGLFVFQTACAVWVLGRSRRKDGRDDEGSKEVDKSVDFREKVEASMLNGNWALNKVGSAVGVDVEKRIEEIRLMAREVRRVEKSGSQGGRDDDEVEGDGDEDEESGSGITYIEKEIDARLEKLRKQFKSLQKSAASSSTGSGRIEDVNGVDSGLMFERKLKFRNPPPVEESSIPNGFDGAEFRWKAQKKKRSSATVVNVIGSDGRMKKSETIIRTLKNAGEDEMISYGQVKREVGDTRGKSGTGESSEIKSREGQNFWGSTSAAMDIPRDKSKQMAVAKKVEENQLVDADDQWWLSLPCVFAILMKRGPDPENQSGLFTLKIFSEDDSDDDTDNDDEDDGLSYVIGFEHRYDANNFCYLLESFFEDLSDFAADFVLLSKNDLLEMMQEQTMKIFVVRKGQLHLYAGQPFRDVEATLKSLIQGNQR